MFTPQEIQEQTFSKAVFGGYDMQQVDDFLEPLTDDYITLYKENSVLKAKMKILVEKLEEYRAQETKQSTAAADAEAKSAQLLKETQARCAAMLQNAEVNAQANAQVNAANVQLAQLNQQLHAEQERLDYAKQTALNFISVVERDIQGHLELLETLKAFFLDIGFASLTFSDPEEHDRIIAFTSQLAHIVSSAYVKSPEAQKRRGFSAGSFQDMTRVARLDEDMWTELFLDDADYLTDELDILIGHLQEYADALKSKDAEHLRALLRDVMVRHGFRPYAGEWWHFTLENEPYPDTYFTFPVSAASLADKAA